MKKSLCLILLVIMAGCGDNTTIINSTARTVKISSAVYSIYSTIPNIDGSTHIFQAQINYSGNIDSALLYIDDKTPTSMAWSRIGLDVQQSSYISLAPGQEMFVTISWDAWKNYKNSQYYFTLVNMYGEESDHVPGTYQNITVVP